MEVLGWPDGCYLKAVCGFSTFKDIFLMGVLCLYLKMHTRHGGTGAARVGEGKGPRMKIDVSL